MIVVKKAPACVVGGEVPWQPLSSAVSEASLTPPLGQSGPPAPLPVNHWTKQQVTNNVLYNMFWAKNPQNGIGMCLGRRLCELFKR